MTDWLQYGALGLLALTLITIIPLVGKMFGRLLDSLERLGDRFEVSMDRQTDSLAAQSRAMEERTGRSLAELHRDVRDGRCRYGRSPLPTAKTPAE